MTIKYLKSQHLARDDQRNTASHRQSLGMMRDRGFLMPRQEPPRPGSEEPEAETPDDLFRYLEAAECSQYASIVVSLLLPSDSDQKIVEKLVLEALSTAPSRELKSCSSTILQKVVAVKLNSGSWSIADPITCLNHTCGSQHEQEWHSFFIGFSENESQNLAHFEVKGKFCQSCRIADRFIRCGKCNHNGPYWARLFLEKHMKGCDPSVVGGDQSMLGQAAQVRFCSYHSSYSVLGNA